VETQQRLRRIIDHGQRQGTISNEKVGIDEEHIESPTAANDRLFFSEGPEILPPAPVTVLPGLWMLRSTRSTVDRRSLASSQQDEGKETANLEMYDTLLSVTNT
jgi:hypothetical protein